ncbi:MAG: hypothetical protein ABIV21_01800 [Pyrinomonadaceae bacterium]
MSEICASLSRLSRPEMPVLLRNSLKRKVAAEISSAGHPWMAPDIRELLTMRVMPYGVGVLASLLIGVTFLTMLFSGIRGTTPRAGESAGGTSSVMLASNSNPFESFGSSDISPALFAGSRLGLGRESPSVNPKGALIALTRSLIRGGMKDDEVVVVADVFGNGLAQIAEVVEPSKDRRAVAELEKALGSDPAYAPFVPTNLEDRPDTVRVVLKFQSVNVSTAPEKSKHQK